MRLSIVTTMFRSAPFLAEFHRRGAAAARRLGMPVEFVYVNDGSPDDALAEALRLRRQHGNVRVVDLSRNFGHHPAMMTGLAHASGDRVLLIDCDLEEAPELLETFTAEMERTGADVVYGVQAQRQDRLIDRLLARAYYRTFNWLCSEQIPENLTTVRLMSRRYVDALLSHREVDFIIAGLWARTGFHQVAVPIHKRHKPTSTYNLSRKLSILVRSVTSFSARPLYLIFLLGVALFGLSSLVAIGLMGIWLLTGSVLHGWTSLMVSIWLLSGLIICCQGVLGLYLSRIYLEVKRRPVSIVRHVHEPSQGGEDEQLPRAG